MTSFTVITPFRPAPMASILRPVPRLPSRLAPNFSAAAPASGHSGPADQRAESGNLLSDIRPRALQHPRMGQVVFQVTGRLAAERPGAQLVVPVAVVDARAVRVQAEHSVFPETASRL